ncbi:MAG: nucleoside triphosphate pyrophosphohydrolase [Deltaproteobacteria bacterium]|nr:MAG: nucleoside triphosphate pyrophosphohydrolase [Deltaproteobacteria bacterium]
MSQSRDEGRLFADLVALMHRLRAPGGCPWDREQTHESLLPYLIEEAYEVVEAVHHRDDAELCEELGDVLLQVVFHAELATERGAFTINDVIAGIHEKLVERHPHVFGDVEVDGAAEVVRNWMQIKRARRRERGHRDSTLAGVPRGMPALLRAHRLGQKAASVGFDWQSPEDVRQKIDEELREVESAGSEEQRSDELGDLLFAVASYVRRYGENAELVLHQGLDRFEERFRRLERLASERGHDLSRLSADELESLWQQCKSGD